MLLEKLRNDPKFKEKGVKLIALLIIAAVILLSFDVFTQSRDGRRQIVDEDGGTEAELCAILADIEGVGEVDVMLQHDEDEKITGVIVTAQGAGVFNISSGSVEVFEKKSVSENEEEVQNEE